MSTTISPLFPENSSEVININNNDVENQLQEREDSQSNEYISSEKIHFVNKERSSSMTSPNRDPSNPNNNNNNNNRPRRGSHIPSEPSRQPKKSSPVGKFLVFYNSVLLTLTNFYQSHVRLPPFLQPLYDLLDDFFQCSSSSCNSSVELEFFAGLINFFSCTYVLAVVPPQMAIVGYNSETSAAVISLITGLGSIFCGIVTNTPLVVAPTTAVSIYFVSNLQQYFLSPHDGNMVVAYVGIAIVLFGIIGPLARFISKLIPEYIQIGTTIGIGLITALSGYQEIGLVEQGRYTLLSVGKITSKICIAMSGLIIISILVYYHSKVAYFIGILWGTFFWWSSQSLWPTEWVSTPILTGDFFTSVENNDLILFIFEMIFLIILTLFGLAKALYSLVDNNNSNNTAAASEAIPKGRILLIVIGVANIVSGLLYGPPIILSPECASGIKAGGKTGLCACITGIFFIFSIFFSPLFTSIPSAATSPVLIMIGMILFTNVQKINFSTKYGIAAFICLTLIPFTDSIMSGIGFGYITFIIISFLNGDVKGFMKMFYQLYCPCSSSSSSDTSEELDKEEEEGGGDGKETTTTATTTSMSNEDEGSSKEHHSGSSISRLAGKIIQLSPNSTRGYRSIEKGSHENNEDSIQPVEPATLTTTHTGSTHGRRASLADDVVERARRDAVAFLQTVVTSEVDLENDFVVSIL